MVGVLLALICGGAPGSLMPLPRDLEPLRGHLTLVGVALAEALVVAFALLPGIAARGQDEDHLEALAAPRGLTIERSGFFSRILRGEAHGRAVQAVLPMGRHSPFANPGQLRIYVSADTGRRIHLTDRARQGLVADLTRGLNLLPLPAGLDLAGLAKDGDGARAWLASPGVTGAVARLLAWPCDGMVLLRVEPDAVCLTVHGGGAHNWTDARFDEVLADLAALGAALEAIGAPVPPEAPWPQEARLQHEPEAVARRGVFGCLGCGGCLGVVLLGSAVLQLIAQVIPG